MSAWLMPAWGSAAGTLSILIANAGRVGSSGTVVVAVSVVGAAVGSVAGGSVGVGSLVAGRVAPVVAATLEVPAALQTIREAD